MKSVLCCEPEQVRLRRWTTAALAIVLFGAVAMPATASQEEESAESEEAIIRLLPSREGPKGGKVLVEALVIEPDIHKVVFYVDGEEVERLRLPPWEARLKLASPIREQLVKVEALDADGNRLGEDEMTFNRIVKPLLVALKEVEPTAYGVRVQAEISIPPEVTLERAAVYLSETEIRSLGADEIEAGTLELEIPRPEPLPDDYVRVVAFLADGRSIEDVALVAATQMAEDVEVHLVQLQVLVINKDGLPMKGLQRDHFEITQDGQKMEPAGLFKADDVSLVLGLSVDSSGSMRNVWDQAKEAAAAFLEHTVQERDRGFLIDFDTRLHLVQPMTPDVDLLLAGLGELEPEGGTALYDSILYSMLQFDREQGRRGLVVLTDGYDVDSRADPQRAVDFGRRLGVPIYILAMEAGGGMGGGRGPAGPSSGSGVLHLLTDPTGGRLFRMRTTEQIYAAFSHIAAELRNQYVLTYYTDTPPEPGQPPKVRVVVPEMKGLKVKTVLGADQIY